MIRQEDLLALLFGEVLIPPAVAAELARGAVELSAIHRVLDAPWLTVRTLNSASRANELAKLVDWGEAEAITLAEEIHAHFLLVDDQEARALAAQLGIKRIGLLGVLISAKKAGHLNGLLKPVLDELLNLGFRASPSLIQHVLKEAGE
jgi:predicted nucleic acid-binding protein